MKELVVNRLADLGYTVVAGDDLAIVFAIQKVENIIKNDCNTTIIPEGLGNMAVDMVCGEILLIKKQTGRLEGFDLETAVKAVQTGDTNITFQNDATPESKLDSLIGYLLHRGRGDFACYRKVRW